jgi:hypothetical protein
MASTEIEQAQAAELEQLQAAQAAQYDRDDSPGRVPILKIAQPLTKDLRDLDAEPGDFIDTLMEESLGSAVEFIPVFYQLGRFYAPKGSKRVFATMDFDTIPETWGEAPTPDGKGNLEAFVGSPFAEHPDAEERYKDRVNAKEIPWGSGPPIQTTHNFTGLVVVEDYDDPTEKLVRPVRLSLRSAQTKAARRIVQLCKMRRGSMWDQVLNLTTKETEFTQGSAWILQVKPGRKTEDDERQAAVALALAAARGAVSDNAEADASAEAAPVESKGLGL